MNLINSLLRPAFDALLAPVRELSPMVGLVPISLIVGVAMLLVFKYTSRQDALEHTKRRMHAGFFEIRLFNDDLRAILRAQWEILKANGRYLALSIVPLLFILPPLVLILAQLQFHYGYRSLEAGDSTLLTVELAAATGSEQRPAAELTAPPGVVVEGEPVWIPSRRQLVWRLAAREPGNHDLHLRIGGEETTKRLTVGSGVVRVSPRRPSDGFLDQLLYPAEPPTGGEVVESIELVYPDRSVNFLGWHTHWIIAFFILSVVAILVLRRPLGVTI